MTFINPTTHPLMTISDKADFIRTISQAAQTISAETGLSAELMLAQAAQ